MVLIDMACGIVPEPEVLTLDTGRLHEETHEFIGRGQAALPDSASDPRSGRRRARRDDRRERDDAVPPLGRAPQRVLRRSQGEPACHARCGTTTPGSPGCAASRRRRAPEHRWSPAILATEASPRWCRSRAGRARQVWDYLDAHGIEHHPLYDRGYTSIGCAPAPGATEAGENERAGRWWWEGDSDKECLLHPPIEGGPEVSLRGSPISVPLGAARSTSQP